MINDMAIIKSILNEYGIPWAVNRMLYSYKLRIMRAMPFTEQIFETRADTTVKRLEIFDINTVAIAGFLKALSDEQKAELLKTADNACEGRILSFSSVLLDYGNPINWQLNPLTGKKCNDTTKWYRIPDFDTERGDIKVIWEVSRFTYFYALARAYLLNGDKKYYQAFSQQLDNWLRDNSYSFGANYKCGQECALRLVNALMAYTVFWRCGVTTKTDETNIKELINRCYRKILSNFFYSYRCIKNNHTISELVGMIIGAWCCKDEDRVEKAYRILDSVICDQFTRDGGYTQFSFNYQRLVLQNIECILSITSKTGHLLSRNALERVLQSSMILYQCQNGNGDVPNYGSNDGALIFPVTSCEYRDYRPVVNCIHALISKTRLYEPGLYDEELLWFAGGIDVYPITHELRRNCSYSEAGLYILRNQNSYIMLVLNDFKTRPTHMDQMHIDLWIDGFNVFCDSGTYSYASDLGIELISASSHNTVKVSGLEQMNRHSTFMLCDWTKRKDVEYHLGLFRGTMISVNGYVHRRQVETNEKGYKIIDEIEVRTDTSYEVLYRTPCVVEMTADGLRLSHQEKLLCSINVESGQVVIDKVQRSLYYLKSETINCIRIQGKTESKKARITVDVML